MKILVVEDDPEMSRALLRALEKRGYAVSASFDGLNAFQLIRQKMHDLIILDLNIPGEDGLHLLQRMRSGNIDTPVLVLSARASVGDRIAGLNAGGDDYLSKPFDLDELDARIRALLRRRARGREDKLPSCGTLRQEHDSGAFYSGDEPLELTPREQAMLAALIARPGHAVTKERLFRIVFSDEDPAHLEAIEVVAHRLRKKLAGTRTSLMTLRGLGYLLREDKPAPALARPEG
jgi:DNA-binding response OmpR family regulator